MQDSDCDSDFSLTVNSVCFIKNEVQEMTHSDNLKNSPNSTNDAFGQSQEFTNEEIVKTFLYSIENAMKSIESIRERTIKLVENHSLNLSKILQELLNYKKSLIEAKETLYKEQEEIVSKCTNF
jgi:hypothetical protein